MKETGDQEHPALALAVMEVIRRVKKEEVGEIGEEEGKRGAAEEVSVKTDSEESEPLAAIGSETAPDVNCHSRD